MKQFAVGTRVRVNESTYLRDFIGREGTVSEEPHPDSHYVQVRLNDLCDTFKFRRCSLDILSEGESNGI